MQTPRDPDRQKLAEKLGQTIKSAREASGRTQGQLAEAVKKTVEWIGKIERGQQWPSDKVLADISAVLRLRRTKRAELRRLLSAIQLPSKQARDQFLRVRPAKRPDDRAATTATEADASELAEAIQLVRQLHAHVERGQRLHDWRVLTALIKAPPERTPGLSIAVQA